MLYEKQFYVYDDQYKLHNNYNLFCIVFCIQFAPIKDYINNNSPNRKILNEFFNTKLC